jgi:hypothetical protein
VIDACEAVIVRLCLLYERDWSTIVAFDSFGGAGVDIPTQNWLFHMSCCPTDALIVHTTPVRCNPIKILPIMLYRCRIFCSDGDCRARRTQNKISLLPRLSPFLFLSLSVNTFRFSALSITYQLPSSSTSNSKTINRNHVVSSSQTLVREGPSFL